jgi:hypothetical protein
LVNEIVSLHVSSRSNADHFQVFSEHHRAVRPRPIVSGPERFEFTAETLTAVGVQ